MSTIKISQLTEKPTMVGTEEVLINDSGVSKKFSTQRFLDVKTACETSETNASNSAVAAAASAASAASVYDSFDDRYLGNKTSDPALDNDGNALVTGALYFNTTTGNMMVYDGAAWITTSSATLATLDVYKFTATAGQTIFTGTDDDGNTLAVKPTAEIVFINGVAIEPTTDYSVTATTLTLVTGATLNDEVNVYAFGNFELADHYSKSASDARYYTQTQLDAGQLDTRYYTETEVDTSLAGKSDTTHNHSGVYEPADATIVKDSDIGVTVQAYDADTAKTDVVQTFTAAQTFNGNTTVSNGQVNLSNGYGLLWGNTSFYGSDATGVEYLRADVNGAEAMRIDTSGNVGIGTSSPNQKLHVNGASEFTGTIYANSNIDMSDNDKLLLGASDDLQIYHDGTNSHIIDNGTGDLYVKGSGAIRLTDPTQSENFAVFNHNGASHLYYDNGLKLSTTSTGVDVTGTAVIDTILVNTVGSAAAPCLQLGGDTNTGFFDSGTDQVSMSNGGTERYRWVSNGDFHADGDVIAYSTTVSDKRLKNNIKPIENALDKVSQLNGCTFTYTADGKESAGLIAQDVEKVLPSAVSEKELPLKTNDGVAYKTVQYDQTIGLLVEAVKELTARVEELEAQ